MKSKEALENLGRINLGDNPYCIFEDNLLKNCCKEEYENIEKDLEVLEQLETLKKYYSPFKEFLEEMFEKGHNEDLTKIKEWLEK